ncbi:oligopeptide transporter, OPT family [Pseudoflavonifractor phocaeensis]|uniref:OPT family oligopeptide transporter n=1 Tax=Pseudoflavonifractor phocaeensis TaxID=1870988 RepID=UPI0025A4054E|nr:oligopeptide transporter, OPT family [Pseudoflavonifractor phocaeensis]MDM8239504.1 oligopeptide transporter, OPT family [Pseudoflavonifractor phocaeensis]
MEEKKFQPYVPADKVMPEFTVVSIVLGAILAIVFGGANAYLGLRVGMTVSASIPAAVISMGVIRKILRRDSILENNMVQTIGSAGESVAAGAIFTLPALFMWAKDGLCDVPGLVEIGLIALCGGVLGVLMMIPLRSALIVKEHGVLAYPEGQACAEVLIAGEEGGAKASTVFSGLGIAAVYKFIADGLKVFPSEITYDVTAYKGSGIGIDVLPALAGVGYICGVKVSSYLFAGGVLGWFVIMPLMALFGGDLVLFPAEVTVNELIADGGVSNLWGNFLRYIGAGAVACGGVLSLIKSLPLIVRTFKDAMGDYGKGRTASTLRTEQDIPMKVVLLGILIVAVVMWLVPAIPLNLFTALIVIVFGFFFATVSSRMVGLIGSSNNPVSGMAIATLLISTLLLKMTGNDGINGMIAAIVIGGVICVIAAIAGDTSQDLKTGFLVGATPKKQQIGELIGVAVSAIAIGAILYLLSMAWGGYGSDDLPAPQAVLMKMIVEGVMGGNLPWNLVFVGVFIALVVEVLGIPVLPFAIGLYLPIYLSVPMMLGGLLRWYLEKRKYASEKEKDNVVQSGVLYSSGLIAGEGIVGILLAVLAVIPMGLNAEGKTLYLSDKINISEMFSIGNIGGLICFAVILFTIYLFATKDSKKK